jgi:hypothetical protein
MPCEHRRRKQLGCGPGKEASLPDIMCLMLSEQAHLQQWAVQMQRSAIYKESLSELTAIPRAIRSLKELWKKVY